MKKIKSTSFYSHIPPEIIFEKILVRVPAKSLMRFKLVCKLWQSTILHDRRFHLSHRSLSSSRPSLLAFVGIYYPLTWYKPPPSYNFLIDMLADQPRIYDLMRDSISLDNRFICASILSSDSNSGHWEKTVREDYCTTEVVNGLVCLYSKNPEKNIYLCNLSTSETMKLPPPSPPLPASDHPRPYHLGFDEINKVYKLLQIQKGYSYFDKKDNSKILTLNYNQNQNRIQDCWRNTRVREPVGFLRSYCVRSALYWIFQNCLIHFDLNKESNSIIQYPFILDSVGDIIWEYRTPTFSMRHHQWRRYYDSLEVGVTQVGGRLALTHSSVGATEFNIWLLDDNYNGNKLFPKWDKITIQIPIRLMDPIAPSFPAGPLPDWTSKISWSSFITIPAGSLPGTKKIVFTIGRSMMYKPLVGFHMPVYTYDLESETWETLDNGYLPAAVADSSFNSTEYSQIYYLHEDNILPLKDILAPYDLNEP